MTKDFSDVFTLPEEERRVLSESKGKVLSYRNRWILISQFHCAALVTPGKIECVLKIRMLDSSENRERVADDNVSACISILERLFPQIKKSE